MATPFTEGVFDDIDEADYHADHDSLSSSGARQLNRMTPYRWNWSRLQPRTDIPDHFLIGTAVHTLVLGTGAEIVEVNYDSFRGKAAGLAKRKAIAAGKTPILAKAIYDVEGMAAALMRHPIAGDLLRGARTEVSAFAIDHVTGEMRRARADLITKRPGGLICADVKTTESVADDKLSKSIWEYGYHEQAPWYDDTFADAGLPFAAFAFLFVEKSEPYEVRVIELPERATDLGRAANRRALDTWARCRKSGIWPSHTPVIHQIDLPRWAHAQEAYQ